MNDLLEIFYNDPDMNREITMVRGNDFCEMLGLFFDLTDRIRTYLLQQVESFEKLQTAFNKLQIEHQALSNALAANTSSPGNGSMSSRSSSTNG